MGEDHTKDGDDDDQDCGDGVGACHRAGRCGLVRLSVNGSRAFRGSGAIEVAW